MDELRRLEVEIETRRQQLHVLVQSESGLTLSCQKITEMSHALDEMIVEYEKMKARNLKNKAGFR